MLLVSIGAGAASFDCKKAKTEIEKTVCGDAALSKLDEELGRAYKRALAGASSPEPLRREQANWLKNRNTVCQSIPGRGRMAGP